MTFGDILITTVKPPVIIVLNDTQGSPQNFKQLLTSDSYGVPKANLVSAGAYKAPKDTYKAPKDTYNAPKDAYKAPTDTYKTPVDSYKAPENAYKTPDASYNGIEDDLKAPGKNAAKMPSAAVTKPFALRRPVQASTLQQESCFAKFYLSMIGQIFIVSFGFRTSPCWTSPSGASWAARTA